MSVPPGGLAFALLRASEWFNDELLRALAEHGWPQLNRTQSLTFAALGAGVARPAELARRVGISRQSMQTLLADLHGHGLITSSGDPQDARATVVALTDRGQRLVADAGTVLRRLERDLARRIGRDHVAALRDALDVEWGTPR